MELDYIEISMELEEEMLDLVIETNSLIEEINKIKHEKDLKELNRQIKINNYKLSKSVPCICNIRTLNKTIQGLHRKLTKNN